MDENFSKIVTIRGPTTSPMVHGHDHSAIHRVVGATTEIPGGGAFTNVRQVTEWCACGAWRSAPEYTDAEGYVSFEQGIWVEPNRASGSSR